MTLTKKDKVLDGCDYYCVFDLMNPRTVEVEDEDALDLDELVNRVIAWGEMHGITNIWSQASKVTEEWGETIGEMNHNRFGANFEDGIGDTLVSLIIFAHINGKDIAKCLADSLRTIQNRDGETIDGNFIKKGGEE